MNSNFMFLDQSFSVLCRLGQAAESYLYTDTDACLYKLGKIGEVIVQDMVRLDGVQLTAEASTHAARIKVMKRLGMLPRDIDDILFALRTARNRAVHTTAEGFADCRTLLEMAYHLCGWFMQTYGDWSYSPEQFVLPEDPSKAPDYKRLAQEREEEIQRLLHNKAQDTAAAPTVPAGERARRSAAAVGQMKRSEAEARFLIDQQLRRVGWEADTVVLCYSKGVRPQKGRYMAIAEWPTDSSTGNHGRADYVLFVGLQMVAIIEAKAEHLDVYSVIDGQCKEYPKHIRAEDSQYLMGQWGAYKVPFTFATNGRPYLKQLETKSGIWFLDLREASNIPQAQQGWMSPEGIMERLEKDVSEANRNLGQLSFDLLRDPDGLNLREYQIRAIEAAESAIMGGAKTALLSMATGTGKTRTILGMIYRFLKTERFRRVLFLVDRTALGEQAQDVFQEVRLEDLRPLNAIYNIRNLDEAGFDRETRIQVATVQSMVKRILCQEGETMPAVSDYDLIIVDEAHRGYILDRELGDDELLYRDQRDYVSKYRAVIDYFDAVKVALTATPALHTTEIFGKPVFNYSYREAVIEGYLVDHDAPHNIKTQLNTEGIVYQAGETMVLYDPVTGEITNSDELEDDVRFDVDSFNRQVITEPFNRTVLTEILRSIDPEGEGKTLIYAVNDEHADLIVKILKELCAKTGVDNDAIMKITGKTGDKKRVLETIRRFKNERYPSIAVTVDLLTTGVDVPEISNLVFLRRVRSRILFEQMLGRATRLCPKIHKTHFEIYDAVGVYDSLLPVTNMKPVAAAPSTSFQQLLDGLKVLESGEQVRRQIDQLLAKLQRRNRCMGERTRQHFLDMTGRMEPADLVQTIREMEPEEARVRLLGLDKLFALLDEGESKGGRPVVISDKEDKLLDHTRGYGTGQRPEDYLDAFSQFIHNNMNQVAALNIVCTRPKELDRAALKSLKLTLDREGFTEQQLNTAIQETTNEELTADIISIIRRYALGSALLSHEERIGRAVARLKKAHNFTKAEENWLKRMETYLLNESVINVQSFNEGAFRNDGGFTQIDKRFGGKLESIILELNEYLYDDGGRLA